MSEQQSPPRVTKTVTPQPPVVEAVRPWESQQIRIAAFGLATAVGGLIHAVCKVFGYCILQNVEVTDWGVLFLSIGSIGAFLFWIVKRVKVGNDPTNTSAPISLK